MSTRALIGKKNETGEITYIYCHHDGYPDYVGKTLKEHYTDEATIDKLLDLGDMSSLGEKPVSDKRTWDLEFSITPEGRKLIGEVCCTYRDRGETDIDKTTVRDEKAYVEDGRDRGAEYLYLFDRGVWFIFDMYGEKQFKSF